MPICAIYLELLSKLGILLKEIEKKNTSMKMRALDQKMSEVLVLPLHNNSKRAIIPIKML